MKTYIYKGSNAANHMEIISIGQSVGVFGIRKMSVGEFMAKRANEGDAHVAKVCESNPKFFEVSEK